VFILANVLRRPIIIFAETRATVGSVEQVSDLPGVYLPLLWEGAAQDHTNQSPICLSYAYGHFWALVHKAPAARVSYIPLVDEQGALLPVRLLTKEESRSPMRLLQSCLQMETVHDRDSTARAAGLSVGIPCAKMEHHRTAMADELLRGLAEAIAQRETEDKEMIRALQPAMPPQTPSHSPKHASPHASAHASASPGNSPKSDPYKIIAPPPAATAPQPPVKPERAVLTGSDAMLLAGSAGGKASSNTELAAVYAEDLKHYKTTEGAMKDTAGELPEGWKCRESNDGKMMYYNRAKGITSWERPT